MSVAVELQRRWPTEPASGRGRSHGTSSSEPFDRWFRYPAGFASDYVDLLIDSLGLTSGTVVDCFAGSGVTGTAARSRGLNFAGIEAHPLVAELAHLKLSPAASGADVRALAGDLAAEARTYTTDEHDFSAEPDLIQRSFSDETLGDLVALRTLIKREIGRDPAALYLKWALLATLRDVAGVKVGWPYQRPGIERKPRHSDAIARFEARAGLMADDLVIAAASAPESPPTTTLVVGDSRDPDAWAQLPSRAAASVGSPPYLNNFDYADATRLELFFWGEVVTWGAMCREVRTDMLTATTQQSSRTEMRSATEVLQAAALPGNAPTEILTLVDAITAAKHARDRRSKEYDQVVPAYFAGMLEILRNLYAGLEPGGTALWLVGDSAPYGVYIDTPRLIGELAQEVGFTFEDDVSLRVRGNRWGQNNDRHKVPLSERLIVMRKPSEGDASDRSPEHSDDSPTER